MPFLKISDNYLSAAVVSCQKKDGGSKFVSYFLHVMLSLPNSAATAVATTAYLFLCTFFFLLSQFFLLCSSTYPRPRWLIMRTMYAVAAHVINNFQFSSDPRPRRLPPWAGSQPPPFPPVLLDIPGDFRFVLLCTHRAPGSLLSRLLCSFGRHLQLHLGTLRLGPLQFGTPPISASCMRSRSLSGRSRGSQLPKSPPRSSQLANGFCVDLTFCT